MKYSFILAFILIANSSTSLADTITARIKNINKDLTISTDKIPNKIVLRNIYTTKYSLPEINNIIQNKEVEISLLNNKDRYGNSFAEIKMPGNNKLLEEEILNKGLSLVYFIDKEENSDKFFAAENIARQNKIGIWKEIRILDANNISNNYNAILNKFVIARGVVKGVYTSKQNTFINFGNDWKTDFTAQIANKTLKDYPDFNIEKIIGKRIMLRGWLENYNGPFIKIYNPQNIEFL